jgi:hypothetical protein
MGNAKKVTYRYYVIIDNLEVGFETTKEQEVEDYISTEVADCGLANYKVIKGIMLVPEINIKLKEE